MPMIETALVPHPAVASNGIDSIDDLPVAYLECDVNGIINRCNKMAQEIHRSELGELLGKEIWDLVVHDQKESSRNAYFAVMKTGVNPPITYRAMYTPSGGFRTFRFDRNVILDANGTPSGMRVIFFDVTERQLELERERKARMWLESISDSMNEAVIVTDVLGFIRFVNAAAEELTGWNINDLKHMTIEKGMPILTYAPSDGVPLNHRLLLERRCAGVATLLNRNRQQIRVHLSTSPIIDQAESSTIGVVNVMRLVDGPE